MWAVIFVNINILKTSDDNRRLIKTYETIDTVNAIVVLDMSILQPILIIEYNANFVNANYAYIEELNRYYYITNIELTNGNRMKLYLTVDVLMSFADDIKKANITVVRNGGIGKPTRINDSKLPIDPNKQEISQTVDINNALNPNTEYCYILGCMGGVTT